METRINTQPVILLFLLLFLHAKHKAFSKKRNLRKIKQTLSIRILTSTRSEKMIKLRFLSSYHTPNINTHDSNYTMKKFILQRRNPSFSFGKNLSSRMVLQFTLIQGSFLQGIKVLFSRKSKDLLLGRQLHFFCLSRISWGRFLQMGEIGDDCITGQYLRFLPENHNYEDLTSLIRLQCVNRKNIRIGKNCWIAVPLTIKNIIMKKISLFISIIYSAFLLAQVGIGTTTPDLNSDLTLGSSNKGLLLNKVALTSTTSNIYSEGMFLYNTATTNDVTPGIYLSNGTSWTKVIDALTLNSILSTSWKTTGNNLSGTDFIGSTNAQPFVLKTNDNERLRIDSDGKVGIGTNAPQGIVDISSANSTLILPRNTNPPANISNPVAGMIIYDSSNKTLRYYNGTQWSTMISSQTLTTADEGVVKMNSGAGIKPSFAFRTSGGISLNNYQNIIYQTPVNIATDFSPNPTTSWPENIAFPAVANIYDQSNGKFLDNSVAGQVHTWRIITKYENKNNGSVAFVTVNMSNMNNTFSIDQTAVAPNGVTTGNLVFYLTTVADPSSFTNGYTIKIKSDTAMDIIIDNITRVSQAKD